MSKTRESSAKMAAANQQTGTATFPGQQTLPFLTLSKHCTSFEDQADTFGVTPGRNQV